ncbi:MULTISPECIES: hypothetical protein [Streptomyces]|uniref:hypothetical protein n=1 Tax=Streptomyces TaxID=1883 RepID=UPI000A3C537D|nr:MULTISPECIES: hypothetical protein [Streptomyces]RSS46715.1 hypothetical protein EF902_11315 [Streptomyces sp. WAC05858]WTA86585.1 hypothetical protein OG751_45930 [Streptomyces antimycoticus]WTB11037.1 hypothetical protein OG546_47205 [Streptomyces antimycoticus]
MNQEATMDTAAAARHARFGKLPERIRYEDMTEVVPSASSGAANTSPEDVAAYRTFSCLALDLGL